MTQRFSVAILARRALALSQLSRWWWLAAWAAAATVTTVLYLAPQAAPPGEYNADKIVHLLVFSTLGLLLWRAGPRPRGLAFLAAANVALAVGLELAQSFVPGREFSMFDILANLIGIGLGMLAGFASEWPQRRSAGVRESAFGGTAPGRATRAK